MTSESDASDPVWRELAIAGYFVALVGLALFLLISPKLAGVMEKQARDQTLQAHSKDPTSAMPLNSAYPDSPTKSNGEQNLDTEAPGTKPGMVDVRIAEGRGNPNEGSFIALDFSLPGASGLESSVESATDGTINVRKVVKAGNSEVGAIDVTIDQNSRLLLDAADVRALMARYPGGAQLSSDLPQSGLMTTRALRDLGIDFRYDPNADVISLDVR